MSREERHDGTAPSAEGPAARRAPDGAALAFRHVDKHYGKLHVLSALDLDVAPGRLVGLVGPNGAGKTTAIRILLGLEKADGGAVELLGEAMPRRRTHVADRVGYMPQHEALYTDLTPRENLAFFGGLQGLKGKARDEAVAHLLDVVDLTDRADTPVKRLSGGMRRRVSLACALVHAPRVAILDEPTVGLDPDLRARIWDHLRRLASEGTAVLVSTHYLAEAEACDRVVFLRAGQVIASGAPRELREDAGTRDLEAAFRVLVERGAA